MNKENFLISVIVPIYNIEDYLSKCLSSISEQSLNNNLYEVILVDDKSTDNSPQIIDDFCKNNNNFKVITNRKRMGIGPSRNVGINKSKGEFLFFIDGDDYIASQTLETMLSIAQSKEADLVTSGFNRVDKNGEIKFSQNDYSSMNNDKEDILCGFFSNQISSTAWGKLYKKSLFTNNRINYPAGIHEDIGVTFKLFWFANKVYKIEQNFYYWVERETSTTASMTNDHIKGWLKGINLQIKFTQQLPDKKTRETLRSSIDQGFLVAISLLLDRIINIKGIEPEARKSLYSYLYKRINSFPNSKAIIKTNENNFPLLYKFFDSFSLIHNNKKAMVIFESNFED